MAKPIKWSGIDNPTHDLCVKRPYGYWDCVHGVHGWVIYCPVPVEGSSNYGGARHVLRFGEVDRSVVQAKAEELIREYEAKLLRAAAELA